MVLLLPPLYLLLLLIFLSFQTISVKVDHSGTPDVISLGCCRFAPRCKVFQNQKFNFVFYPHHPFTCVDLCHLCGANVVPELLLLKVIG